jgi:DNA-binding XRE family transcriptional regulator
MNKTIKTECGKRLAAARIALGMTQETMAEALLVERKAYAHWETGRIMPQPLAMIRLKQQFGISLDWIYAGDPSGLSWKMAKKLLDVSP